MGVAIPLSEAESDSAGKGWIPMSKPSHRSHFWNRVFFHVMAIAGGYAFVFTLAEPWQAGSIPEALATKGGDPIVLPLGPAAFADLYRIPYAGMSATQFDTVCVDLEGKDLGVLRATFDGYAGEISREEPQFGRWYARYLKSEAEYAAHCLRPAFPVSYISAETGALHRASSYVQCRAETMDGLATEYVNYLKAGGVPITLPATVKPTGCGGTDTRFAGRIQSVHGALIDAYRAIGLDYPETRPVRVVSTQ